MYHVHNTQTYINASERLDEACDWLRSIGVLVSGTRIATYKKIFTDLASGQKSGNLEDFESKHGFANWVNAAYEVADVIRIYDGLKSTNDSNLTARLRQSLKGHVLHVLDDGGGSARDFTFELSVAANFARHGYKIDFGHDADVEATVGELTLYVECKRLRSRKQVKKRIKEGLDQLGVRYGTSTRPALSVGLLALSIGRLVNPQFGMLEADDAQSLGDRAFQHNAAFVEKYRSGWQDAVDGRTLGVVVVLDSPGIITKPSSQLTTVRQVAFNNCVPVGSLGYDLLLEVANRVFAPVSSVQAGSKQALAS